jgi:hypothetical protein
MTDSKLPREYTTEEAASIITRVLDRHSGEGGRISHDELLETARDIGVTTLELEEAVVAETRARAEALVREEERQRALRRVIRHLATYVIVSAFCYVIDVRLTGGVWYTWVLLGWGLVVALHALRVVLPTEGPARAPAAPPQSVEVRDGKLKMSPPSTPG